ncbi:MAG: hypothetical protein A3F11_11930 [Gammaproteobacteria bacterium RIFCSPHIGHO2_12_FULL_37_14]|nr:MAG: hypothetical protein A3F11_11930 [Gammaproteobacteria bacterium RIFCSPHIGHO2_12_FULL_37_14]
MKLLMTTLLSLLFFYTAAEAASTQSSSFEPANTQLSGNQTTMTPAELNKIEEEKFLEANKVKPGVITLDNGLQYKELIAGNGPTPTSGDTVTVNYAGTLVNGTEFDSSYKRGEPATFPVSGVIAGWTEALKLMKVGSTWELYIPAKLAYGTRGVPSVIGPNQMLIFKVQLISIKK